MSPYTIDNAIIMEHTDCDVCHDCGFLDYNVYCSCAIGVFYEGIDELDLQIYTGDLDIGLDDHVEIDSDSEEYANACSALYISDNLPFNNDSNDNNSNDGDISDNLYSESDDEYQDNTPWISDYKWNVHNDGQCDFPCDVCAYEDSTW